MCNSLITLAKALSLTAWQSWNTGATICSAAWLSLKVMLPLSEKLECP